MDNKNWITKLAEKNPSPALVAGMLIVIITLATVVTPILYYQNRDLSREMNQTYYRGLTAGKEAADTIWAPIVKLKNTELLIKDRKIDTLYKENNEWVERYILFVSATSNSTIAELKATIAESKAADREYRNAVMKSRTMIKRGEAATIKLENINANEN